LKQAFQFVALQILFKFFRKIKIDRNYSKWDYPIMKVVADSRGRLAAMQYFRPGKAFDISPLPDGGLRVIELVERKVPVIKLKRGPEGLLVCPRLLSREEIVAYIRAERDAQ
jgi:hypothetical protein